MGNHIAGKIVVITGVGSGLGEATARHLSEQGATVVLGARRIGRINALAKELAAALLCPVSIGKPAGALRA